ncbi:DUF2797 domain-containing protein [Candidatus Micrarchaeota archaeon]|nr:DUF2797 domain-containing protein [Candidatus Micrarchaeota archaeon]MBD3418365.1 DUF2797 domain-containing protein [Candidatus Micrarchaeota archaeon]
MPPKHMISFFSTDVPSISYWEGEEEASAKLEGNLKLEFEGPKACVGFQSRNRRYRCPYHYEGRIQCPFCGSKDISRIYTRHDFKGYEELEDEFSEKEFSIYLVSFGERVKCGVTQKGRIRERVKEQGADYYAEIMQLKGAEAYEMERLLQSHFGFSNAVQARTKLKLLGREDPQFLENAIVEVESTSPFNEYMLDCPSPKKIDYSLPEKYSVAENINGKVLGAKGPLLFFENPSGSYVSNLKAHTGRFFTVQE